MITIIHGDNIVKSRQTLVSLRNQRAESCEIISFEGKKLDKLLLEEALGTQTMFTEQNLIIIEKMFTLPKSKKLEELIAMIAASDSEMIIWEDRVVTPTMLRIFPNAKNILCKTNQAVFQWLDSLSPGNAYSSELLHRACEQESPELCFFMLVRQVRLLLQTRLDLPIKAPPFIQAKLRKQSKIFSEQQLFSLHERLLELDEQGKTSSSLLPLEKKLDLLLFSI